MNFPPENCPPENCLTVNCSRRNADGEFPTENCCDLAYGVVDPTLSILESFWQERSVKVVLDGQSSPLYIINAGIPQGSVLEATLFLVFSNDLPDEVLSRIRI